jgi:hypothetical protein
MWSPHFDTAGQALKAIRACAIVTYLVSALSLFTAFVGVRSAIYDAVLGVVLASWLQLRKSKAAAVLLLIDFGVGIGVTAYNQFGGGKGGKNVVVAVIAFAAALNATAATFKLRSLEAQDARWAQPVEGAPPLD